MLRNGLSADAQHAMMGVSVGAGAVFQFRSTTAGPSQVATVPGISAPRWVKLSRRGDSFAAYESADGVTWNLVGQTTMVMPSALKAALVVTSHRNGTANTAHISRVTLTPVSTK
jgi:hypothetical protein